MTPDPLVRLYIDQLLADFRKGYEPFVITVLKSTHGADWFTVLRNTPELRTSLDARDLQLDATALVRIILAHWDSTFGRVLSYTDRSLLHEIRTVRNRWAHQASVSLDDVDRLADNVIRLLSSIQADHTQMVIAQREEFRVKRYTPVVAQRAWRKPIVWITAISVGLLCTLSLGYAVLAYSATGSTPYVPLGTSTNVPDSQSAPQTEVGVMPDKSLAMTETPVHKAGAAAVPATPPDATFVASDAFPCLPGQIKGNARTMIFHRPDGMYYAMTRNASVMCFNNDADALAAGFRASKR